jgi:phage-related protein
MSSYDGSIRIDTRVDTKGINKGTKGINASLAGVFSTLKRLGKALFVVFSAAAVFRFVKNIVNQFDFMNSSVGGSIKQLKTAFEGFKGALAGVVAQALVALTPTIITVIGWLTKLLQVLSTIISVLFGVQNAMTGVANSQQDVAKETQKAGKAAKGALAPFDELNVLQDEQSGAETPETGGLPIPQMAELPGLASKIEDFKNKFLEFIKPVIDAAGRLWEALKPLGETIWAGLKWAWDNILVPLGEWVITDLLPAFLDLLASVLGVLNEVLIAFAPSAESFFTDFLLPLAEWVGGAIIGFLEWLTIKLNELAVWIRENPEKFREFTRIVGILIIAFLAFLSVLTALFFGFSSLTALAFAAIIAFIVLVIANWENLKTTVEQIAFIIGYYIKQMVENIKAYFADLFLNWLIGLNKMRDDAIEKFLEIGQNIAAKARDIRENFVGGLFAIRESFFSVFTDIYEFLKGIVNNVIDLVNGMVSSVIDAVNSIASAANNITSIIPGVPQIGTLGTPVIPGLASGAVLHPNAPFAAIVGDQRNGTNIEAPADLIRSILREELAAGGGGSQQITIKIEGGNMAQLVRMLKPELDKEDKRRGTSLVINGTGG